MTKSIKLHIDATSIDISRASELQDAMRMHVVPLAELRPRPSAIVIYVRYNSLVALTRGIVREMPVFHVEQRHFPGAAQFHLLCKDGETMHIASRYDVHWTQDSFASFCDNASAADPDSCIVAQSPIIHLRRHFWPANPVAGALMSNLYAYVWNLIVWRILLGIPMALLSYLVDKPSTLQTEGINAVTVMALVTGERSSFYVPNHVKWIKLDPTVTPTWIPATGDSIYSWSALRSQSRFFSVFGNTLVLAVWIPLHLLESAGFTLVSPNRMFNDMVNMYRESMTIAMTIVLLATFIVFFTHLSVLLQRVRLVNSSGDGVSVWPLVFLSACPLFAHIASFAAHCRKHLGSIPTAAYAMSLFYVFVVFLVRLSVSWFTIPMAACLPGFVMTASYAMNQWYAITVFN